MPLPLPPNQEFEQMWGVFAKATVYDTLLALGIQQSRLDQMLLAMKRKKLAMLRERKASLDAEITKLATETGE